MSDNAFHEQAYLHIPLSEVPEVSNVRLAAFISLENSAWFATNQAMTISKDLLRDEDELIEAIDTANKAWEAVSDWWAQTLKDVDLEALDTYGDELDD